MGILAAPTTNANALKARPAGYINKKIMESAGDLGVPRIVKKAPTTTKEFSLSSARSGTTARKFVRCDWYTYIIFFKGGGRGVRAWGKNRVSA